MNAKDFLDLLAASLPQPTQSKRAGLLMLSPRLAVSVPASKFTVAMVDAIAPDLPATPRLPDILQAIERAIVFDEPPPRTGEREPAEQDPDELDRQWWRDRIARWRGDRPEIELANLRGAMLVLTGRTSMQRGRHHPRPTIVRLVEDRIEQLEAEGVEAADLPRRASLSLTSAAPPPKGPLVSTRPTQPPTRQGSAAPLPPDVLERMRQAAGVPPALGWTASTSTEDETA